MEAYRLGWAAVGVDKGFIVGRIVGFWRLQAALPRTGGNSVGGRV